MQIYIVGNILIINSDGKLNIEHLGKYLFPE